MFNIETLKINVLSLVETGNVVFDSLLKIFFISFLTTISGKVFLWLDNFNIFNIGLKNLRYRLYFWWKCPKKIIITGNRYLEMRFMRSRLDFSMRFNAFLEKIVESLEKRPNNLKLIKQLKELQIRENVRFIEDDRVVDSDFQFIVFQPNYFELDENIYCNIKTDTQSLENEKKNQITKEEYIIEIWSDKFNCSELIQYIEQVTDKYEKSKKALMNNKKFIFKFDGSHDERGIQWQITEFNSKRTLDHVFFENKAEVMSFLERFIRERELYERIGKPWQLGILLEGEPGCGKTSFIVGLANYLNRSIKDCQFNRMKTVDDLENCINCVSYSNKDMSVENVIMVAEDFDCMTDIAKSRKLLDKEIEDVCKRHEKQRELLKQQMDSMKSDEGKAIMYAIGQQSDSDPPLLVKTLPDTNKGRNITLSNLLNILDGINSMPGRIIIFSTNCPEKLDEAFLRPGRIDLRIRFGRPDRSVIREMMSHWYKCIDNFYKGKYLSDEFNKYWDIYETQIVDGKLRPCDITNLLQKYGENIEGVFKELV